jgi:hypothetical protein
MAYSPILIRVVQLVFKIVAINHAFNKTFKKIITECIEYTVIDMFKATLSKHKAILKSIRVK